MAPHTARLSALVVALAGAAFVAACGSFAGGLPPGTPIAEARRAIGGPTGEHRSPDGRTRLEFAQGSFGRQTFMLDFDAQGRLVRTEQVLTEANFAEIRPGMSRDELRYRLGRPAWVFGVARPPSVVWNWRFFTGDCVVFQVNVSHTGSVLAAGQNHDPACDGPNTRE